ncbi:MAG: quinone-dependent dihydroorotate dehydrogenase [Thermomicrobiales bacterium]|nr:quinone-dependent dihydroorotate dehydrogenase [Thermomicrobiales bacterium]
MMLDRLYQTVKPALFRQDPETVHDRVMAALDLLSRDPDKLDRIAAEPDPRLTVSLFGLDIPHPLGIAAGLDKNGVAFPALLALGFGHVEIGTVTPRPQEGNPKPRVFRLVEDRALINRMGFPGRGVSEVVAQAAPRKQSKMVVGCNIGPNKASVESGTATEDLVTGYRAMASMATWVTVNVSSPNTANLRSLQHKTALREMLTALNEERRSLVWRPLLVKISPDLEPAQLDDLIDVAIECQVDGLIATNTTISRPASLKSHLRDQTGGLSGPPVAALAVATVRRIAERTNGALPIIAAGGIETGADVVAAIEAGASLCQTYTGFIYRGLAMARLVGAEIIAELDRRGVSSIANLRS